MNYGLISRTIGYFCFATGAFMLPSVLWAIWFAEWAMLNAFLVSMLAAAAVGAFFYMLGRRASDRMFQREALAVVSLSWFAVAAIGAFPYLVSGELGVVDAYFESMSGFTTTGSTVIVDIAATPKSLLFWRSLTQWLGGMGIIVLFIAVLPYLGAGGKQLFRSETPGPDPRGLSPHIKDTASILYKIYLGLTALETLALLAAGLSFYDATTHTLSTLATGGFSPHQASIAEYDNNVAVEVIIIAGMGCAGTNFGLFFAMIKGNLFAPFKDTEWRVYISLLAVAILAVTLNLMYGIHQLSPQTGETSEGYGLGHALRASTFQVVSIMTTTGFASEDFDTWPHFSRMLLLMLMFIGGSAGSTAGGMKVIRIIMLAKMAYWRIENTFRPKTIRLVRIGNEVIDEQVQIRVFTFLFLYILWFAGGSLVMSALGLPFQTAVSAVIATLNNIGPGLELVGATQDFAEIPTPGKIYLTLCMILGRLEMFSICVLFIPSFWKRNP